MEGKQKNQTNGPGRDDLNDRASRSGGMLALPRLILASGSPRRAEILRVVGWPFETLAVNIDESRLAGEDAAAYVQRLAREKAITAAAKAPGKIIVGADTSVAIDSHVLEKPGDPDDARRMLQLLSDRWHRVLTGVALVYGDSMETKIAYETTEVKFAMMGESEIEWYVATGEPMDKAGAYAIQGLGARFIEGIKGDYFNVMGLPVRLLYELLTEVKAAATTVTR